MAMALKLGKCRLCLKLGDFYSIFTMNDNLQLAEMVMECTKVKIYEGDGLPDKICSECIQKLSSAHIFKQQCERADEELRRNYVPPPGFSVSPTPPTRQSSDSAFSNNTDVSNKPSPSAETLTTPVSRNRKRSHESLDNASTSSQSHDKPGSTKRVQELRKSQKPTKRSRTQYYTDSDYDCNSPSQFSIETDSDDFLEHKCKECGKRFDSSRGLINHMRMHEKEKKDKAMIEKHESRGSETEHSESKMKLDSYRVSEMVATKPLEDARDSDDKLSCERCGKTFKLKIMLKRHHDVCTTPPMKELKVSLEPIDGKIPVSPATTIECEICNAKFKTPENLDKHLRVVHAAAPKIEKSAPKIEKSTPKKAENGKIVLPCMYCRKPFTDYYSHNAHFNACCKEKYKGFFDCPLCHKMVSKKASYFLHIKGHFMAPASSPAPAASASSDSKKSLECRICKKKMASEQQLVTHLAAHMSNMDNPEDDNSRGSTFDDVASVQSEYSSSIITTGPLQCKICDKRFTYKKALDTHIAKHSEDGANVKAEPPDKDPDESADLLTEVDHDTSAQQESGQESDSSQEGDDNTCDICEKQFSYKRLLIHHKRTKHPMTAGTKRAKVNLKNCSVRCLICDIEMKVSDINEHNQTHISVNIKPRNLYTCMLCEEKFKSCSSLANHIKLVHRLKQPSSAKRRGAAPNLADFCEVVVTKAEPLDELQSHNGFGEVSAADGRPLVNLSGFTCHICSKQMPTLISLNRHVNWHTNVGNTIEKKYECMVCKEVFRFQCHYKMHMRVHYKDTNLDPKLLTCSICNRRSKHLRAAQAHMNYHKQTRFKTKDYECSICKRVFQYRKVYLSHMAIHYKKGDSANNTIVGSELPTTADRTVFDGTHTCHICNKVCDSESSLKHHIIWHSSKTLLYGNRHECHICNLVFTNKKRMEVHTREHFEDDNGPYKCHICGKGYIDEDYFKRHVKGHNFDHQSHKKRIEKLRKDKVKCPICTRYYPDLVKLIRHLRRTHPESKMIKEDPDAPPPAYFSCKLCAKVFLDERRLQHHEEAHLRKPEFFKCKFCGKKTISLKNHNVHIKGHLTQKFLDNPLSCPHCDEKFTKGYHLHYHLRDVHEINETWIADRTTQTLNGPLKEFQCSICLKILASKGNFERHLDYHNSLRCNYCFDYFSSLRFLEGHLTFSCEKKKLIGDTEIYPRRIKCQVCYKAFHLQVKLDCHLRTQHGIKVFKEASEDAKNCICDYCFKVFENEYALNTHKIYHRTIGYYGCIYCDRKFNTLTTYRKHKNHHFSQLNVDNPTKCEHCDETFVAFRQMIYHMRDDHGDDKEWIILPKESTEEKCSICNKVFFNLHRHLDYHEENKCKKCNEYFYSTLDFDNHLCAIDSEDDEAYVNTSTGGRNVPKYEECRFCFKPITKAGSVLKHDQIHRSSGSISCRFCDLKFKTMDAFNIHAFSHRNRKYNKKPIKCRDCGEKFVKYGPFIKHVKSVHKNLKKLHYRAVVKEEPCVVCGEEFPNLHNHYRAHLQHQCQQCHKYFTSFKVFSNHECDKEDSEPSKVFTSDVDLPALINSYVPKDVRDDEKYYGYTDDDEEEEAVPEATEEEKEEVENKPMLFDDSTQITLDEDSQNSVDEEESNMHSMVHAPIISDVLSLYKKKEEPGPSAQADDDDDVVNLIDDDSVGFEENVLTVITIED